MKSLISTEMKTAAATPAQWGKIFHEKAYQDLESIKITIHS